MEYTRDYADRKLEILLDRVIQVNKEFIFYVNKLIVFGSYINTDKNIIHDLDIGIDFKFKSRYTDNDLTEQQIRAEAFKRSPNRLNYIASLYWGETEILNYLRSGDIESLIEDNKIYSFHNIKADYSIITNNTYKIMIDNGLFVSNGLLV